MYKFSATFAFIPLFLAASPALACCTESFRTTETLHGLFEIREAAVRFIAGEPDGARWRVGDPNLKIVVPRCTVPLKAAWLPKSHGASGDNIVVSCPASIETGEMKTWDVFVGVDRN